MKNGFFVHGKVVDDGTPIADAFVKVHNRKTSKIIGEGKTSKKGHYRVELPTDDNVDITIVTPDKVHTFPNHKPGKIKK